MKRQMKSENWKERKKETIGEEFYIYKIFDCFSLWSVANVKKNSKQDKSLSEDEKNVSMGRASKWKTKSSFSQIGCVPYVLRWDNFIFFSMGWGNGNWVDKKPLNDMGRGGKGRSSKVFTTAT